MSKKSNTIDKQVWALQRQVRELQKRVNELERLTPKKVKRATEPVIMLLKEAS